MHGQVFDAQAFDQFGVDAAFEAAVHIEHVGEATGHAGAEVDAGFAEYGDHAAGHVFAAVVTDAFHYRAGTGIAHGEAFAGAAGCEQLAAGGAIQAGVAGDGGVFGFEGDAVVRFDHNTAARHAFADVVVGVAG